MIEEKTYEYKIYNDDEYEWFIPWYNQNVYVLRGYSVLPLLNNIAEIQGIEIPELQNAEFEDFTDDSAFFKKNGKTIEVMVFADNVEEDILSVVIRILIYS